MRPAILDAASALASTLAETAIKRDEANALPFAEIELLRGSGLLLLLLPAEAGGLGGRWSEAVEVTRLVSGADGSIGHLIGYHYLNYLSAKLAGTPAQAAELDRDMVDRRWFLGDSVNPLDPGLTVSREGDRIRLSGKRSFATGAAVADRILLTFRLGDKPLVTLLPRDRAGVRPNADWDNLGQRLTASGSLSFDDVLIGVDEVLGDGPDALAPEAAPSPMSAMIQTMLSVVQLGIAEGALAAGAAYTRENSRPWFKSGVARAVDDPLIVAPYGELAATLAAARALARQTALALESSLEKGKDLSAEERGTVAVEAFALKIVTTQAALNTTAKIFELMGARASANRFGFDRFWRNARTLTLHDPVAYKALEVGRFTLLGELPTPTTYS